MSYEDGQQQQDFHGINLFEEKLQRNPNRSKMEIVGDILLALHEIGGMAKKYELYIKSRTSVSTFTSYLDFAYRKGLVDYIVIPPTRNQRGSFRSHRRTYRPRLGIRITNRGHEYLQAYYIISKINHGPDCYDNEKDATTV